MSTGKTYSTKYLLDSNNNRGAEGQVLSTTSTGIDWVDANTVPGTGLWLANGNDIYNSNSGNVGIGNTDPQQNLHIVDTDGANIILNSNTGAENNGIFMTEGGVATPYVNGAYVHYDSTNNEFKINTGASSLATRFTIARDTGAIQFNAYDSTNNTGTPTYILGTDASGNVVKVLGGDIPGGGGTVTGTGSATQVAFWDTNTSLSGNSQLYWDNTSGFLGINDTTPSSRLKILSDTVDTNIYTVDIKHARNDANVATHAMRINMDLSGADTTTADRLNSALLIDIDSSANGDATHEHRIYGVNSQVNFTGFTDLARSGYFLAESNYTGAKTSQLVGVYGQATHDADDVAGGVSNMYGAYGYSSIQDTGDVDNAFGVYGLVTIGDNRVADVGVTKAVEGEITIDKSTAISYGNMIGISSIIDNNEGAVPNFGNQYLFKGDYQGTKGSDAYGLFIEGDKHYLAGKLGLNNTDPTYRLDVTGSARVTGAYYDSNDSPGTSGQVLSSTATGTDWIDGSAIPGVPSGSGTLNTIPLWTPDGDTLGNSIITQPSTGVVRVSGDSVYFSVTDTSAAARNIDIGHWVSGQTNIESQGGTLSIGTQSNHNIVFETNGSTKATILSGGNVGIGVTAPAQKLHVGDGGIRVEKFATGLGGFITIGNATETSGNYSAYFFGNTPSDTNYFKGGIAYETLSATFGRGDMHFLQNDSSDATNATISDSVMTILNGGNVGIGTTSPGAKLEVGANVAKGVLINRTFTTSSQTLANVRAYYGLAITPLRTGTGGLYFTNYDADTPIIQSVNTSDVAQFLLLNPFGGNVGIGTTSPDGNLEVITSTIVSGASDTVNNVLIGLQAANRPTIILDTADTTYTNRTWNITNVGSAGKLFIGRNGLDVMVMDNSGNVGIGTTSPNQSAAASSSTVVSTKAKTSGGVAITELIGLANNDNDKAGLISFISQNATSALASIRGLRYTSDTTGKLAFFTSGTEKMRIDYNGNVGIGTTSPAAKLEIAGTIFAADGNKATPSYSFTNDPDTGMFSDLANTLRFGTGANTRMTIEPSGEVGINTTGPSAALHLRALTTNGVPFKLEGDANTTVEQMLIITSKAYNSTDAWYNLVTQAGDGSGGATNTCIIERDGDLRNKNNSYGQISDSRLKENIIDATPKLEDVMKVKVKNFNFIGEDLKQIGVVAQELEEVFPGLVKEEKQPDVNGEEGGIYKSVKYSVLVPILVKAMQEQQEIIEDLKIRITKLEN